ncbi:sulfite exporter TauE/SafE family protein [Gordonia sp. GAMMA]|uniref:sulfite exporter TauE/SafE family protein n=1 Tax=Gordonia sp. GAMMA TaxID=2502241 RepID=UPI00201E521D|nr:sulfite exporter TauE/SafE family protein [Gordonia sp. GAMMA]
MNLTAVLITGLFAGGVSCAAVQGGLLTGLITRQRTPAQAAAVPAAAPHPSVRGPKPRGQRSVLATLGEDLTPVGGFLAGKLLAYTVLGALLGALGSIAQLSVGARMWLQIGAGLLIIAFGLAQLGVPGFRAIVIEPPASWSSFVRGRARSRQAFAPALLGVATILIPCGVTLSVEALALASGSAIHGAAIMAVFVVGTSPLFAVLGYAARKAATAWNTRLAVATGLVVVAMGLLTLNGGLELAGSPFAASRIGTSIGFGTAAADTAAATVTDGKQEVVITARSGGYSPKNIQLKAGVPTTVILRADSDAGCTRTFTLPSRGEEKTIAATGDTRFDLGALTPGTLPYVCGMGMYTGTLTIT